MKPRRTLPKRHSPRTPRCVFCGHRAPQIGWNPNHHRHCRDWRQALQREDTAA